MFDLLTLIGGSSPFIPHGHCYLWKPQLVSLHLVSDALIAAAYYSIPITLLYFVRRRKDLPFHKIFLLFAAFIVSCGTTHLAAIWTLWYPTYWLSGLLKAFTAFISVFTALELIPLVPLALALSSPAQLEQANAKLQAEIQERQQAEENLRQSQNLLEQRVQERTLELAQTNDHLRQEIRERQRTEDALRRSETVLNAFLTSSPVGMAFLDQDLRYVHINQALADINGLASEAHPGRTLHEVLPQWADQLDPILRQVIASQTPLLNQEIEGETYPPSVHRHVLVNYFPVCLPDGDVLGVGVTAMNITDLKQAEAALRASEEDLRLANERFRLAARAISSLIYDWDVAQDRVERTEGLVNVVGLGLDEAEPTGTWWRDRIHPDDLQDLEATAATLFREDFYANEYRVLDRNGQYVYVLDQGLVARRSEAGVPLRIVGSTINISDRKQAEAKRQQAEEALRVSEQRFRALFEDAPDAIFIADSNGTYIDANANACHLVGCPTAELIGKRITDLLDPEERLQFQAVRANLVNGKTHVGEWHLQNQAGERVPVEISAKVLPDGRWQAFVRDIRDRKAAEAERLLLLEREKAARAEAEQANRIKDEFLAVLSHELRSPLNPILGWATLLQRRQVDEQTLARALTTIERNIKLQLQLIDDLLDVSRILRGKLNLTLESVDLTAVIAAAIETVRLSAEAKSIQITAHLTQAIDPVRGDAGRLQQIVWNLLSNAVKFTPAGGQVDIWLDQIGRTIQIRVQDTGKGISPSFLPHVFEYFRQEDGSTTRQFGGLGLGLAIVRYLVEMHGGTVSADSPGENRGATFTLQIPCLDQPPISPILDIAPGQRLHKTSLQGITILVAEDETDTREFITFMLEQTGASVITVSSGREALAALEHRLPDILISDIGMPGMDGYMLVRSIRALPAHLGGSLPAIALTAYAGELDQQRALNAGFQLHVAKPVDSNRLVGLILQLVRPAAKTPQ